MCPREPTVPVAGFEALDIRSGTAVRAEPFPEARRPATPPWIGFGAPGHPGDVVLVRPDEGGVEGWPLG